MSGFGDLNHLSAQLCYIYGEIWLFPKHNLIIKAIAFLILLQAQAKHIACVTSFAIGWAVLEIWTTSPEKSAQFASLRWNLAHPYCKH